MLQIHNLSAVVYVFYSVYVLNGKCVLYVQKTTKKKETKSTLNMNWHTLGDKRFIIPQIMNFVNLFWLHEFFYVSYFLLTSA